MVEYDVGPTGYDDSPNYSWDESFTMEKLVESLEHYNTKEDDAFTSNLDEIQERDPDVDEFTFAFSDNVSQGMYHRRRI